MSTVSSSARPSNADALTASRARYGVIGFAITLAVVTYIDRVCISKSADLMMTDLRLTKDQMGYAFSTFAWAYALFEIPGGWLGDRLGPRSVLLKVVLMWSIFTALTGWAWGLVSLVAFRFVFGIGEAGCFPNLTKAFTLWLPAGERVKAQGVMWLSARWGGAFTPLLVVWVLTFVSWRWAFTLFGTLGFVWAFFFARWFRDRPKDHPAVNAAELAVIGDTTADAVGHGRVPWGAFLRSPSVWLLWLQYFCMSYSWYFFITWMPTYLKESFPGLGKWENALLNCIPLFFGGLGSLVSGLLSRKLAVRFGTGSARRRIAMLGFVGAAVMMLVATRFHQPVLAMLAVGFASFCNDLAMPPAWAACMEVGGRCTGSLSGSMNMMGNLGSAVSPLAVAWLLSLSGGNWNVAFYSFAIVYGCGALCWAKIDPVTPIASQ